MKSCDRKTALKMATSTGEINAGVQSTYRNNNSCIGVFLQLSRKT